MSKWTTQQYILEKPRDVQKYPVGKIAGKDSHSYSGGNVMHVLRKNDDGEWVLLCNPRGKEKLGVYSYMGFRAAITCGTCLRRRNK